MLSNLYNLAVVITIHRVFTLILYTTLNRRRKHPSTCRNTNGNSFAKCSFTLTLPLLLILLLHVDNTLRKRRRPGRNHMNPYISGHVNNTSYPMPTANSGQPAWVASPNRDPDNYFILWEDGPQQQQPEHPERDPTMTMGIVICRQQYSSIRTRTGNHNCRMVDHNHVGRSSLSAASGNWLEPEHELTTSMAVGSIADNAERRRTWCWQLSRTCWYCYDNSRLLVLTTMSCTILIQIDPYTIVVGHRPHNHVGHPSNKQHNHARRPKSLWLGVSKQHDTLKNKCCCCSTN